MALSSERILSRTLVAQFYLCFPLLLALLVVLADEPPEDLLDCICTFFRALWLAGGRNMHKLDARFGILTLLLGQRAI